MPIKYVLTAASILALNAHALQLPQSTIVHYDCTRCQALEKQEVTFSWSVKPCPIREQAPLKRQSVSYLKHFDAKELSEGIAIDTTAPEAVIRLSLKSGSLLNNDLFIESPTGQTLSLIEASQQLVDNKGLQDSPYFSNTQSIFQLDKKLGKGRFLLKSRHKTFAEGDAVLVHVFDKLSSTSLDLQANKINYFYDEPIEVDVQLSDDSILYPIDKITANLIDPDGTKFPLRLERVSYNHYKAQTSIISKQNSKGQNWTVRVDTQTYMPDSVLYRHATTEIGYTIPSAVMKDIEQINAEEASLHFKTTLDVSTQSRYGIEAVLYGVNDKGEKKPIMATQSANWFSEGTHQLDFQFDEDKVTQSSLNPPYSLGNIKIMDFGQLRPVYQVKEPITLSQLH